MVGLVLKTISVALCCIAMAAAAYLYYQRTYSWDARTTNPVTALVADARQMTAVAPGTDLTRTCAQTGTDLGTLRDVGMPPTNLRPAFQALNSDAAAMISACISQDLAHLRVEAAQVTADAQHLEQVAG